MPRRGPAKKRKVTPDVIYGSELVSRLINRMMKDGKKSIAEKQVYGALGIIEKKTKSKPVEVFDSAIEKIKPLMEVRPRRVGGAAYQVPIPVRGDRKVSLAIRWLIFAARARSSSDYHTFSEKLAAEIIDASNEEGGAVKKKQEMERMAEANRAFAHFRW
ncbi:MAG: 30S ribosomal protein S7 [Candidatus Woesebacteria bacterium GW2011_GWB1_43_14]|uniref:Small ribosomal subunit protein uS7 n=1 Tax=Candidatus Woesebacteria bacterium GW2011_GWB1_43_14 TaxID=1618578 RepID=A0A0G1GEW4_9BACT|nr:MAG: 30S ribosomal protein S7 [Candidatus Woesebacteria bacterium GW2011_GWA1_39_11b]KKS78012.1 MAG: 30S ribosomal protein S7 [Candidatus Woesebacteria bacterium GW2011_GWC1_42_9]KKS97408.1 MAG: 30S ribosomal protein S7 [Candidatus Woesebacteria bacterium GW2011_GWB1_43_14]